MAKNWKPLEESIWDMWVNRPDPDMTISRFATTHAKKYGCSYDSLRNLLRRLIYHGGPNTEKPEPNEKPLLELDQQILALLAKSDCTLASLSEKLDHSESTVNKAVERLRKYGYRVDILPNQEHITLTRNPRPSCTLHTHDWFGETIRFGQISDTHLGSKYERLDFLSTLYGVYKKEGITTVYHAGDLIDGQGIYKGHEYEVNVVGFDAQCDYCIENYPKEDGITTYYICGNHDLAFQKLIGANPGDRIHRDDLQYLGDIEVDVDLGFGIRHRIYHPGGGKAYADSYKVQRHIEGMLGGTKPNICAYGHWHSIISGYYRNVHYLGAGTTQGQTSLFRTHGWQPALGGWIVEINVSPQGGINRIKTDFISFYWESDR